MTYFLQCIACRTNYPIDEIRYRCNCGGLLDAQRNDWKEIKAAISRKTFDSRLGTYEFFCRSGVWRYGELLPPLHDRYIVSKSEGNTPLYEVGRNVSNGHRIIGEYAGIDYLSLKHEGYNPTGSFKDRGMTVGISMAKYLGVGTVACASTGNTSASLASYAALGRLACHVYLPKGKIASSKIAQTIGYGAKVIEVDGDFDIAMKQVEKTSIENGIYLLNSINPFRIEGQKAIAFELFQQLRWEAPDWIVIPGGNLGNTAAIGKGSIEFFELGVIKKIPRIAVIQAVGANPFYRSFKNHFSSFAPIRAETVASAICIGNPVSYERAKRVISQTNGIVAEVTDQEILDAKAVIDRSGIGCEPGSATTIAGIKKLVKDNVIKPHQAVSAILTGHILKDPDTIVKYH